ncbi:MAG: hypothetical protein H7A49_07015 [Akkermansiaceae bacterium]|nr:hypothetical protein [Akkermansiaceae bacterium]
MPLTEFQRRVLEIIRANRSEASHFAGGVVLNGGEDGARFSNDFDLFHDAVEDLARHSESDVQSLAAAGYEIEKINDYGNWDEARSFRKAIVRKDGGELAIDWAQDAAWRFFPVVEDPLLGWRLHLFDMATNKALALSARTETRDYVDIVELGERYGLESIIWAACGKDEGFTPLYLLDFMRRFARISPGTLDVIKARDLDPIDLKRRWTEMHVRAEEEITRVADTMPDLPIGIAFIGKDGEPGWIGDDSSLIPHAPTYKGCWPVIHGIHVP